MAYRFDSKSFVPTSSFNDDISSRGHVTKQRRPNMQQFADYSRIEMSGESVGRQALSADLRLNSVPAIGEKFLHANERRYDSTSSQNRVAPMTVPHKSADSNKRVRNQAEVSRGKSSFFD